LSLRGPCSQVGSMQLVTWGVGPFRLPRLSGLFGLFRLSGLSRQFRLCPIPGDSASGGPVCVRRTGRCSLPPSLGLGSASAERASPRFQSCEIEAPPPSRSEKRRHPGIARGSIAPSWRWSGAARETKDDGSLQDRPSCPGLIRNSRDGMWPSVPGGAVEGGGG